LIPVTTFLKANGRVHHYRFRPGTAKRAIVFANSLGTDLRIWDGVITRLPADISVLSYDKSGHGLSEGGAVTMIDFAQDLAALMDQLGLSDALVCGVSVGGMIAQTLASLRPDLVAGLVLCNTSHRIGTPASWADRIVILERDGLDAMANGILERWFSPTFAKGQPDAYAGYRLMLTRTPTEGYRAVCAAISNTDLTNLTSRLTCPAICIAGADDQATHSTTVEATANMIVGARYLCLPNVGHLPCIEAPDQLQDHVLAQWKALT